MAGKIETKNKPPEGGRQAKVKKKNLDQPTGELTDTARRCLTPAKEEDYPGMSEAKKRRGLHPELEITSPEKMTSQRKKTKVQEKNGTRWTKRTFWGQAPARSSGKRPGGRKWSNKMGREKRNQRNGRGSKKRIKKPIWSSEKRSSKTNWGIGEKKRRSARGGKKGGTLGLLFNLSNKEKYSKAELSERKT